MGGGLSPTLLTGKIMARYLRSTLTDVVLPYVEASLKSKNVVVMTASECQEYEATLNRPAFTTAPIAVAPVVVEPVVVEPEIGEMLVEDFDPVADVLGALETD